MAKPRGERPQAGPAGPGLYVDTPEGLPAELLPQDGGPVDHRAMELGVDSAGGAAVPYQLDGTKSKPPRKRK